MRIYTFVSCACLALSIFIFENYLGFANKVLFDVGPACSKKRADATRDSVFKLVFPGDGTSSSTTIWVRNHKVTKPPTEKPVAENGEITLTLNQAGLLAVNSLCNSYATDDGVKRTVITPLTAVVFDKLDIPDLYKEVEDSAPLTEFNDFMKSLNASCQSEGHNLGFSRAHIAAAAVIHTTKAMKNSSSRKYVIRKVLEPYIASGVVEVVRLSVMVR